MFDLRAWLRRAPKPRKLRLHVDGDERIVDLGSGRCKWAEVEQTVTNARPSLVECLDDNGEILRSHILEEEPSSDAAGAPEEKLVSRTQQGMAAVIDAYGKRMVDAFRAGSESSAVVQQDLMQMVAELSHHHMAAIANMHNLAVNLSQLVQQNAELAGRESAGAGDGSKSDQIVGLLTAMITGGQARAVGAPVPVAGVDVNGKRSTKP